MIVGERGRSGSGISQDDGDDAFGRGMKEVAG